MMSLEPTFGILGILNEYSPKRLEGRKRLQKIVCVSQYSKKFSGFNFEFTRHYYGPYSFDLKRLIDRLVSIGFVEEKYEGPGYTYKITKKGQSFYDSGPQSTLKKVKQLREFVRNDLVGLKISTLIQRSKESFGW